MNSKIVKNTSYITIGKVLPQVINILFIPIYSNRLGAANNGTISTLLVAVQIMTILCSFGLERSIYRLYYDYKDNERKDFLGTLLISYTVICFGISVLSIFGGYFFSQKLIEEIAFYPYYVVMQCLSIVTCLSNLPITLLQVEQKIKKFVILHIVQFCVDVTLKIIFLFVINVNISWQLIATIISYLVIWPALWKEYFSSIHFKFKKEYLKDALSFSIPMLPALLSAWVLNVSDRFFIRSYFTMVEVGIYSIGYKLGTYINIIPTAFYTAYNPIFYKLANENKDNTDEIEKYNTMFFSIIIFSAALVMVFSKEIIYIFFDKSYHDSYRIIQLISISTIFSLLAGIKNLSLYQVKKNFLSMIIVLVSSLANIALNFILIPRFGMFGAAYSTIISFVFQYFAKKYYADKLYKNSVTKKYTIMLTIILVISLSFSEIINLLFSNYWISASVKAIMFASVWGICLIRDKSIREMIMKFLSGKRSLNDKKDTVISES